MINQNRVLMAVEKYLMMKGYGILEDSSDNYVNVIALDEKGNLHFIHVFTQDAKDVNGFSDIKKNHKKEIREQFEEDCLAFLFDNYEYYDCAVSFDDIEMLITSDSRAILRHNISIFGGDANA